MIDGFEHLVVVKRSGQRVAFNGAKIAIAIKSAFDNIQENNDEKNVNKVYTMVLDYIASVYTDRKTINVEDIQDIIETTLKKAGFNQVYEVFNDYRIKRAASREAFSVKEQHKFVKAVEKIASVKNTPQNKPMDLMFNFGKTISKEYAEAYLIETKYVRAHDEGRIYIQDLSSYPLGITERSHLDLTSVKYENIEDMTEYIINTLRQFKNEQYGEQTICDIDEVYKEVFIKDFKKEFISEIYKYLSFEGILEFIDFDSLFLEIDELKSIEEPFVFKSIIINEKIKKIIKFAYENSLKNIREKLEKSFTKIFNNIESFDFSLAKSQVNFSVSTSTFNENLIIKDVYYNTLKKLPKLKSSLTIIKYYKNIDLENILSNNTQDFLVIYPKETEKNYLETFSDGLIISSNINGDVNTSKGRIVLSTISINLARLGLKYTKDNIQEFYSELDNVLELSKNALIGRYELQASRYKENFDYLFKDNLIYDSYKLEDGQKVRKVLRNGVLNISYIGLVSCLKGLLKKEDLEINDFKLGLEILSFMREKINKFTIENKLNFELSEEISKDVSGSIIAIDKAMYGVNLKYNNYITISEYLKNFELEDKIKLASKIENIASFDFNIGVSKNVSYKKLEQIIEDGFKAGIKTIKVRY